MQQLPDTPVEEQYEREDSSNAIADSGSPKSQNLTKRELLELADYLYGRYQASKKPLNKGSGQPIIEANKGHKP